MKKIIHHLAVGCIFLIPIFPLIVANSYFFPFITGKAFYVRTLVELAFALTLILAFMDAKYRPRLTPLSVTVVLFALIVLVADLIGVNPLRSLWSNFERMEGWIVVIHLAAFFLVTSTLFGTGDSGRKMWHRWFNMSLLVSLVTAMYGVFQLVGWYEIHQGSSRLDASLGNSAYLAIYMLFSTFLAAYMFIAARKEKSERTPVLMVVYGVLTVLFTFILAETQTRGTILGLIGGAMLALVLYAILAGKMMSKGANPDSIRLSRQVSSGIVILMVILGATFWANRHSKWVEQNPILGRFSNISWSEASSQARQYIWPMAIQGAMKRPFFGWGQENFNYIFNADYNPKMWSQEQWFDRAHSVFLDWLVASGVVGLIAYLLLYGLFLRAVWKSRLSVAEKSVLTGLLAGYFVHNIFVFDNLASYVLFFATLGFVDSLEGNSAPITKSNGRDIEVKSDWVQKYKTYEFGMESVEYIVAPIVIVLLAISLYFVIIRPIQANQGLISALQSCGGQTPDVGLFQKVEGMGVFLGSQELREQVLTCSSNVISSQSMPGPTKKIFFDLAQNAIQTQIASAPKDARIYVLGGSFMNGIGQAQQALPLLEKGHELSPAKQSLDMELASTYLSLGRVPDALALLKTAYESAPDNTQVAGAYATVLIVSGKEADAKVIFKDKPEIFNSQQMANAYASMKQYAKAVEIYQTLIKSSPKDLNLKAQLAQFQYAAGDKLGAITTLRSIEVDHPEYKDQIEAAIKQVK